MNFVLAIIFESAGFVLSKTKDEIAELLHAYTAVNHFYRLYVDSIIT